MHEGLADRSSCPADHTSFGRGQSTSAAAASCSCSVAGATSALVLCGLWRLLVRSGGGPAAEDAELLLGSRSWRSAVDGEGEAGVGRELHRVEGDAQVTDQRVAEPLGARMVQADVVSCPAG